jgi:membrane protein DedA with SNARE-associated domain
MINYSEIVNLIVNNVSKLGYIGIFILMFLESSFFPFPSEIVMIPAGYLAYKGELNLFLVIFFGTFGSFSGAWFNYFLAKKYGRKIVLRFLKEHHLSKIELFFEKHGEISTFNGRLIPVIRQYISFPAGLAKMNFLKFSIYTTIGAFIWVSILTLLGYFLGKNQNIIHEYLTEITIFTLIILTIITIIYIKKNKKSFKIKK